MNTCKNFLFSFLVVAMATRSFAEEKSVSPWGDISLNYKLKVGTSYQYREIGYSPRNKKPENAPIEWCCVSKKENSVVLAYRSQVITDVIKGGVVFQDMDKHGRLKKAFRIYVPRAKQDIALSASVLLDVPKWLTLPSHPVRKDSQWQIDGFIYSLTNIIVRQNQTLACIASHIADQPEKIDMRNYFFDIEQGLMLKQELISMTSQRLGGFEFASQKNLSLEDLTELNGQEKLAISRHEFVKRLAAPYLKANDPVVRGQALRCLFAAGDDEAFFGAIEKSLKDEDGRIKNEGYVRLTQKVRSGKKRAWVLLVSMIGSGEQTIAERAQFTAQRCSGLDLGSDVQKWEEWWRRLSYATRDQEEMDSNVIARLVQDSDPWVRLYAYIRKAAESTPEEKLAIFLTGLNDNFPTIRERSAKSLGHIGNSTVVKRLSDIAESDSDPAVVKAAKRAAKLLSKKPKH